MVLSDYSMKRNANNHSNQTSPSMLMIQKAGVRMLDPMKGLHQRARQSLTPTKYIKWMNRGMLPSRVKVPYLIL